MDEKLLSYQIALTQIQGVGPILAKKLVAYVGSVEGIFSEKKRNLIKISGVGDYVAEQIIKQNVLPRAEKEIEFIKKFKIKPIFYLDKDYPERLSHCSDSPVMLFMMGETDLNTKKIISIVGTRSATQYGKDLCNDLVTQIADRKHDVLIVSGLAYGIDVTAHKAALTNNLQTVAVLGHGLDIMYPATHKAVAKNIMKQGALLTEFLSNSDFLKQNFVKRNRIVAGMSDATIVVESSEKGGALITAEIANSYNRDVFAFPGRIDSKYSLGCNKLIKTNKAALIESVSDLEYILGWDSKKKKDTIQFAIPIAQMSDDENKIYSALKSEGPQNIDILSVKTNMPVNALSVLLLNLEFSGLVKSSPGKMYEAIV